MRKMLSVLVRIELSDWARFIGVNSNAPGPEFSTAVQNSAKGRFSVELKDLKMVELGGCFERPGAACLSTPTFHFNANWTQPPSAR